MSIRNSGVLPALTLLLLLSGCATISTLSQPAHKGKPLVMSGSRLNISSLSDRSVAKGKYGVPAPRYPLLDLPFSAFLDILVFPYTVPAAIVYSQ